MQIPALIVTGALGAGKSTFIRRVAERLDDGSTAILVNEFAQTGIDQDIFDLYGLPAIALTDGCICCATRGDVRRALQALLFANARRSAPPIRRVILETSGLADPISLAEEFSTDLVLAKRFRLSGILTVVDATCPLDVFSNDKTIGNQISVADHVVLSKTDVATSNIETVLKAVRRLNAVVSIEIAAEVLAEADSLFVLDALSIKPMCAAVSESHANGHSGFTSVSFEDPSGEKLLSFAEDVIDALGPDLVRLKGLLKPASGKGCTIVNAVRGRRYAPTQIVDRILAGSSRLVAIATPSHVANIVARAHEHGLAPLPSTAS